jgi:NAD(P)-dependent dehydrogenase (short-subunit alcohol dehydrogenase family)
MGWSWLLFVRRGVSPEALAQAASGKTVLITGASFGIGEHLALTLGTAGARLLLVARSTEKLMSLQHALEAQGARAEVFVCDLRDAVAVEHLLATLRDRPGGVDVVISNAGKSIRRSIFDSLGRLHDFNRTMAVNYQGPVQLLMGLMPLLVQRRGHIVNVSAVNVLLAPTPYWAAYQASKAAFDQWFRCAGPELKARGVATTSVYLPLVRTRMIEPTRAYRRLPALEPQEAANLICRSIISRCASVAPWWTLPAQLASMLLRRPWEALWAARLRKRTG